MIGLFGGTFDPVHIGHLRTAVELQQSLQLDEMRMVPCANPYHRESTTSVDHRLAMLKLAIGENASLSIDDRELRRIGPSYTVDTLTEVRSEVGKDTPLALCLGMDTLADFASWHCWESIPKLAHIVVVCRPGFHTPKSSLIAEMLRQRKVDHSQALHRSPCGALLIQQMTPLAISATQIRKSVRQGLSIKYLVPEAVERYITHQGLYIKREGSK